MLMGKFNHAIDAKGRLIIPAKIKEQLGAVITVLKGTDNCLRLYSAEEWALYAEKISALPSTQSRAITRYLYSNALEIVPDSQGRVLLPQEMLDELYTLAKTDSEIESLVSKFPERDLVQMIDLLYRFLMSRPDPMEWLEKHANVTWTLAAMNDEPMARAFCAEAGLIVEGMLSIWRESEALAHQPLFPEKYVPMLRDDGQTLGKLKKACEQGLTNLMEAFST